MTTTMTIPQFTLADRLRKAREVTGMEQIPFAEALGVSRQTVTNYEKGHVQPRRIVLKAWSMATGVPIEWLMNGETPAGGTGGGETVRPEGFEPPTFWLGAGPSLTCIDAWELAA